MDNNKTLAAFSALSQQTRLDVFRLLIKAGDKGLCAGDIGQRLNVRQNTMSANLLVLRTAGLVKTERTGRTIQYFANFSSIRGLLSFLMEECCGGNPALCTPIIEEIACAS